MKKIINLLILCFLTSGIYAQKTFTLEEAVGYAILNNPSYKLKSLDVAEAEAQVKEFTAIGLPKLTGKVDYNYYFQLPTSLIPASFTDPTALEGDPPTEVIFGTKNNLNAGLELTQLIFDGSFFIGLEAQRLYKDLVKKQVNVTAYEIESNVTLAYLNVLTAVLSEENVKKNIANLEQSLSETRAIYESGFAEKLDVDRLELSLENLKAERDKVVRLIDVSFNLLKFRMGFPLDEDIAVTNQIDDLVDKFAVETIAVGGDINLSKRPEYILLQAREEINLLNVKRIKAGYLPSLVGYASHQQSLQRNKLFKNDIPWLPTTVAGLSLNIPIFDGFDRKSKLQTAKINVERIQLEFNEFQRSVSLQVMNGRTNFLNARQTLASREKTMDMAQRIFDTTQIKYREGVGSSVELSQAERELYAAQSNYVDALYQLLVAKTELDIASGDLGN